MELNQKLNAIAEAHGADYFGVADLTLAHDAILDQGGPEIAAYPRAISVGIRLLDTIVDLLPQHTDRSVAVSYQTHCYDVINERLDLLTSLISSRLQQAGHRALPIPAATRVDDERICASFSHKLAARLSGLGWIGKSCLLITPEAGPRVRWATVLTDAPLSETGHPVEERCGNCNKCMEICPAQAFTGESFRTTEPRDKRFDARKCIQYYIGMKKDTGHAVCGLCIHICPHGNRHKHQMDSR